MDELKKKDSVKRIRLFSKEVLKISDEELYQVTNTLKHILSKERKIKKEIIKPETDKEIENWLKV